MRIGARRMAAGLAAVAAFVAQAGGADPIGTTIPLAPYGDAIDGTSGQPVALSPTSLLVSAQGADGVGGTADDVAVLMRRLNGTPITTSLATGYGATAAARIERLSATRAAMVSAGTDGLFATADDALLVLDRLGSGNAVTPVVIGGLGDSQQFTPERLSSNQVVVPSLGADLLGDTADDEVVVVTIHPAPAQVDRLAAPFQRSGGRSRIAGLSPEAFLIGSDGPDKKSSGADDLVYSFRFEDGSWARTDLAAPGLNRRSAGRCVRLSSRYGLVVSAGADFVDSNADDEVLLLDSVDGVVTHIAVPYVRNSSGAQASVLAPDRALFGTRGADGIDSTADDAIAVLSDLGGTNTVSNIVTGPSGDNNQCRPVELRSDAFAMSTFGADRLVGTYDDSITVVTGVGSTPLIQSVVVGALANGTASTIVPLSSRALLVAGGGPDQTVGTSDDAIVALTGIGGSLAAVQVPLGGALDAQDAFRYVPVVLGNNRAALLTSGADDSLGSGDDDGVRVVNEIDLLRALRVRLLRGKLPRVDGAIQGRPSSVNVKADFVFEDLDSLMEEDITLSIGNASQTFAAGSLVEERDGRFLVWRDPANDDGVVRLLRIDRLRGTIEVQVRGADDDVESTDPEYVPVGIDVGGTLVPDSIEARASARGFRFRRGAGAGD